MPKLTLCLFTDSREPSGVGEVMLTLACNLLGRYAVVFGCIRGPATERLCQRLRKSGITTFALPDDDAQNGHRELGQALRRWRVDIFHAHAGIGWECHTASRVARQAGVPLVVRTEHLPYLLTNPAQRAQFAALCQHIDQFICVSDGSRQSYLRAGVEPQKLSLVRNGITAPKARLARPKVRAALGLTEAAQMVLTVARLTEQKGHADLLEAMRTVLARQPAAQFVWAGDGPLHADLLARAEALGVADHLHVLGHRADVADLMAAADLFVLPSRFEGLPLVVLEAMALGLPVVATAIAGTEEAVEDGVTGRLAPAGQPRTLAAAIVEALDRPQLAARWAAAGRRRFQSHFTAARMAAETDRLYQQLWQNKQSQHGWQVRGNQVKARQA